MALEPKVIKLSIVEGTKLVRQATEGSDQPKLPGNAVNDETEPGLLRKLEPVLGFTLNLNERIACREQDRAQVRTTVCRKRELTDFVSCIERPTQQISAIIHMLRPGHDQICKAHIRSDLEA